MMNIYLDLGIHLHRILLLIDIQSGFKEIDYKLMDLLEYKKRPYMIVFTKTDKIKTKSH